jgi:hypothetical protein
MAVTEAQLKALRNTIPPIEWRVQSFNRNTSKFSKPGGLCVSYTSVEVYQELLDSILGNANWQVRPCSITSSEGLLLFCELAINVEGVGWVVKSDVGAAGSDKKEPGILGKTLYSDALKRAAYLWGLGRIHKFLPKLKVKADCFQGDGRPSVINDSGKKIFDITEHVNTLYKSDIDAAVKDFLRVNLDAIKSEEHELVSVQVEEDEPQTAKGLIVDIEAIVKDLAADEALAVRDYVALCEQLFKDHPTWNWEWVNKFRVSKLGHNKASGLDTIPPSDWDRIVSAIQTPKEVKKGNGNRSTQESDKVK